MDSLLATYASSDEEEDQPTQNQPIQPQPPSKFGGNLFSNLPPPSSSKPDKLYLQSDSPPSAALFSKLPQPKSERSDPFSVNPKPRKVVQFRPPVVSKVEDDDDDDDDNKVILKTTDDYVSQAPSVKSFLSSIPAPRNSGFLGAGAALSAGAGRRSILEAQVQGVSSSNVGEESADKSSDDDKVKYDHNVGAAVDNSFHEYATASVDNASYGGYDYSGYGGYQNVETDNSSYGPVAAASVDNSSYGGYEGYGEYGIHGQYESKWIDRSSGSLEPEIPLVQSHGKRGRNEIPAQVIEVNQDELMKNRPREDQVKLTGIAFGPSYQPVSSAKGKPSKLHKRKHQIGTLYFDMRSKEAELAERRSKGFLTKAQTQAKYGW